MEITRFADLEEKLRALNIPLHTMLLLFECQANVIILQCTAPCSPIASCPSISDIGSASASKQAISPAISSDISILCREKHTISLTCLFLLNSSLANRSVSSRELGSAILRLARTIVRHRDKALPLWRNCCRLAGKFEGLGVTCVVERNRTV